MLSVFSIDLSSEDARIIVNGDLDEVSARQLGLIFRDASFERPLSLDLRKCVSIHVNGIEEIYALVHRIHGPFRILVTPMGAVRATLEMHGLGDQFAPLPERERPAM